MRANTKHKIQLHFMHTFTHRLKAILCDIFNSLVYKAQFHGVKFSTCDVMLVLAKF